MTLQEAIQIIEDAIGSGMKIDIEIETQSDENGVPELDYVIRGIGEGIAIASFEEAVIQIATDLSGMI